MARRFVDALLRATKNIKLYLHARERFTEFLAPAHAELSLLFAAQQTVALKIGASTLEHEGETVYEDDTRESLTYALYRDGIRIVAMRSGISIEELLAFALLLIGADDPRNSDDMVTRLWKAEFHSIDYVAVESFGIDENGSPDGEADLERIVAHLSKQLAATSASVTRLARFSADDLAFSLDGVEEIRGVVLASEIVSPEEQQQLQRELAEEELYFTGILEEVLFELLENSARSEELDLFADSFTRLIDALFMAGDLSGAIEVQRRVKVAASEAASEGRRFLLDKLYERLSAEMLERQRLDGFLDHLAFAKQIDLCGAVDYLKLCGSDQLPILLEHLPQMKRPDRKRLLVHALIGAGRDQADVFVAELRDKPASQVRELLAILQQIDPDVWAAESLKLLEGAIGDPNPLVRANAYRTLSTGNPGFAAEKLSELMAGETYPMLEEREKVAIASALGETRHPIAMKLFSKLFEKKKTLFGRARLTELRRMAVVGLEAMQSVEAFRLLNRELQNQENGRELQLACREAALRIKNKLEAAA